MRGITSLIAIAFLAFTFSHCSSSKKTAHQPTKKRTTNQVNFVKSNKLFDVLDDAEEQDKLVFVDFYTDWCLPCKLMDDEVFNSKDIAQFMNKNFINYKVNAAEGNGINLAAIYEVSAFPTLIFMDGKGHVIERKVGATFHTELKQMAERALNSRGKGN